MSAQPHLNGAYYGPSIPPPDQPRRKSYRPGRGGGCNPFTWCCCCLFNCALSIVLQILIGILVILGIVVLIFWLIFRPNVPKFHVNDASLTQFDFNNTNQTLFYNLALNMTFRNPNRRIGIHYDRIEARAYYHGERFSTRDIPGFYLGHKKESYVNPQFSGQQIVRLSSRDLSDYNSERSSGVYEIDVKLKLRIRFKVGSARTAKFTPDIECDLKIPFDSNGRSTGNFERKKCGFDW